MTDPFYEPYDREDVAYGEEPSASLSAYLDQVGGGGKALDLGAGAGRDSIALALAGYHVLSVDLSNRGLERVLQRAVRAGVRDRVETHEIDVRDVELPADSFDVIVATTVLDHISPEDSAVLWRRMTEALTANGMLYVQVHTIEDPGSDQPPGVFSEAPVSETAGAVVNYFSPNQLAMMACDPSSRLRVLRYEERLEWDYTHGPEHLHGKAVLLAVRMGAFPAWYGEPAAFPRR
ncbi:class I SAM-dependent methyltransferase [Novipirellula artificiosorum]|uniref:Tellurite resistance protein TehB n=1 Tax=Novipirellula artificiosorum TaxID=2528016 RepID=A0A5C6DHG9_9BACT|nr:class I SAM-dependent methyltransferase [Novipirellula artificiosorum]TWU35151.1 tellurite resistance protein TehB [Novipirellula artificiosorum]